MSKVLVPYVPTACSICLSVVKPLVCWNSFKGGAESAGYGRRRKVGSSMRGDRSTPVTGAEGSGVA